MAVSYHPCTVEAHWSSHFVQNTVQGIRWLDPHLRCVQIYTNSSEINIHDITWLMRTIWCVYIEKQLFVYLSFCLPICLCGPKNVYVRLDCRKTNGTNTNTSRLRACPRLVLKCGCSGRGRGCSGRGRGCSSSRGRGCRSGHRVPVFEWWFPQPILLLKKTLGCSLHKQTSYGDASFFGEVKCQWLAIKQLLI